MILGCNSHALPWARRSGSGTEKGPNQRSGDWGAHEVHGSRVEGMARKRGPRAPSHLGYMVMFQKILEI